MSSVLPPTPAPTSFWRPFLRAFWPAALSVDKVERLRMAAGGFVGILFTAVVCHWIGVPAGLTWIIAPMGASAVLVFGVPASPLAQPWSVLGGNTVSALVSIACVNLIPHVDVAAASAVGLSIAAMVFFRCLHPPGGATALLLALAQVHDPSAAFYPVFVNSLLITIAGLAYNNATKRRWPHVAAPAAPGSSVTEQDLDAVLARYNQVLDINRDDLRALVEGTTVLSHQRHLAETTTDDIMTRDVATVEFGTPLQEAWALLRSRKVKTLPVVDKARHIVGIVTMSDFLKHADLDVYHGFEAKLKKFLKPSPSVTSDKAEVVGQIMTRRVRVTREHRSLADLVELFNTTGHRHIPVIGADNKLVGIITQSDVVAALKVSEHTMQ